MCSCPPSGGRRGVGQCGCPRVDKRVCMRAVCDITVDTLVVSVFTMGARGRGDVIFPKRGIVGIPLSGLESKQPLMPCQPACFEWFPRGGVEVIMCVCRGEVMCPDFMGWGQKFAMADDVPGGRGGGWWWGGVWTHTLHTRQSAPEKGVRCGPQSTLVGVLYRV